MLRPPFIEDEIYHIFNRGTEKRTVFTEDKDYSRFIHDLFELNDEDRVLNVKYYSSFPTMEVEPPYVKEHKQRKMLVEILAFVLMPNHYHLLLKQRKENGIVKFMQKLGTGYTMYFNKKYERVGGLFQGRFKAVLINREAHLLHIPHYIHLNPLDLTDYGGSTSIDSLKFLENFKWSSFPDYIGIKNYPSVTSRKFLLKIFNGPEKYKAETVKWLKEREKNVTKIKEIAID
jgi:putative transposase